MPLLLTEQLLAVVREPTAIGTVRRIQALIAGGRTWIDIAARTGFSHTTLRRVCDGYWTPGRDVREAVARVFDDLRNVRYPAHARVAAHGWPVPSQWADVDIDDPGEEPTPLDDQPDEVVVERVLAGKMRWAEVTHQADRAAIVRAFADTGLQAGGIASRLDISTRYVRNLLAATETGAETGAAPPAASEPAHPLTVERFGAVPLWELEADPIRHRPGGGAGYVRRQLEYTSSRERAA